MILEDDYGKWQVKGNSKLLIEPSQNWKTLQTSTINPKNEIENDLKKTEALLLPLIDEIFVYLESVGYKPTQEYKDLIQQRQQLRQQLESLE